IAVQLQDPAGETVATDSLTFSTSLVEEPIRGRVAPQARYTLDLGEAPAPGTWTLNIELADQYGNTGSTVCTVEVAAAP
ncbi:MAG: hypothetical protein KGO50_07305, partial [Myxococcales bacterium]|nr:hypothetical protein [Myxococcales bacterium]